MAIPHFLDRYRLSPLSLLLFIVLFWDGYFYAVKAFGAEETGTMLDVQSMVGDIVDHPAFRGFSPRLLPNVDDVRFTSLPISQIDKLMPYHSNFNQTDIVNGLNFLIEQKDRGHDIFYDFYSVKEMNSSRDKRDTGLVFFKGKPNAPFVIVVPGGGFEYVGSLHEGFPIAKAIAEQGLNAFVVVYRTEQGGSVATQDLAHAIDYIISHTEQFEINANHYSIWGGSAGARMAANIGSYLPVSFGGQSTLRPDCIVMLYTGHSDYTANDPPTYVVIGERDWIASPSIMRNRVNQLRRLGIRAEFNIYPSVGHGFALGTGTTAQGWNDGALAFCRDELFKIKP
jgi:acetyl esterase/lipase